MPSFSSRNEHNHNITPSNSDCCNNDQLLLSPDPATTTPTVSAGVEVVSDNSYNHAAAKVASVLSSSISSVLPPNNKLLTYIIIGASVGCAVTGAAQILSQKWQNMQSTPACEGCAPTYFVAPFTQELQMFAGEALCLLVYLFDKWWRHMGKSFGPLNLDHTEDMKKKKSNPFWWILPACCDIAATGALNYSNTFTLASTVTVLRNLLVLITAGLRLFWLRYPLTVYQYSGVTVITLGMILSALYGIINPETDTNWDASLSWLGIVLALVGTAIQAVECSLEEAIFKKRYMHPMAAMGYEGVFGLIITGLLLVILQFTGGEDVKGAFYQTFHNGIIAASTLMYIVFAFGFNGLGLTVTFLSSALLRTILFASRSILVWAFELCVKWATFDGLSFAGQIVSLLGVAFFANAFSFPCWPSFNRWWKKDVIIKALQRKDGGVQEKESKSMKSRSEEQQVLASGIATSDATSVV